MKKIKYYILAIFSVLALCLVPVGRVSALSDIVYNFDGTNNVWDGSTYLCTSTSFPNNSPYLCKDYKYLIFNFSDNSVFNNASFIVFFQPGGNSQISAFSSKSILFINNADVYIKSNGGNSNFNSNYLNSGFTATLTDSIGGVFPEGTLDITSNGTYDVTNYASASVEVEESSFIVQLFSKGFWGVATAIVTIVVPIIALFIVFRLVHDLLWGRG